MTPAPQRLLDILRGLHPWLRDRVSAITITPLGDAGWDAAVSFLDCTTPPPPGLTWPAGDAARPGATHHPLALSARDPDADLFDQLREIETALPLGRLDHWPYHVATTLGGGSLHGHPQSRIGRVVHTHTGRREQRDWRRRVGQEEWSRRQKAA